MPVYLQHLWFQRNNTTWVLISSNQFLYPVKYVTSFNTSGSCEMINNGRSPSLAGSMATGAEAVAKAAVSHLIKNTR